MELKWFMELKFCNVISKFSFYLLSFYIFMSTTF